MHCCECGKLKMKIETQRSTEYALGGIERNEWRGGRKRKSRRSTSNQWQWCVLFCQHTHTAKATNEVVDAEWNRQQKPDVISVELWSRTINVNSVRVCRMHGVGRVREGIKCVKILCEPTPWPSNAFSSGLQGTQFAGARIHWLTDFYGRERETASTQFRFALQRTHGKRHKLRKVINFFICFFVTKTKTEENKKKEEKKPSRRRLRREWKKSKAKWWQRTCGMPQCRHTTMPNSYFTGKHFFRKTNQQR